MAHDLAIHLISPLIEIIRHLNKNVDERNFEYDLFFPRNNLFLSCFINRTQCFFKIKIFLHEFREDRLLWFLNHVNDCLLAATVLKTKDKYHKLMVLTP